MTTRLLSSRETAEAGRLLASGELVVIPTETVYGLAAAAVDPAAVASIFAAKGRPADNPLIVHLASVAEARATIPPACGVARAILDAFAPGPITVVVPAPHWVVPGVTAGLPTVALRVPADALARAVLAHAAVPAAAPSANRSGRPSPTTFEMARSEMEGAVAAILDGGDCPIGVESTVVDATDDRRVRVLRPGAVTAEMIAERIGAPVHSDMGAPEGEVRGVRSPGTRHRHYRPSLPVIRAAPEDLGEALTAVRERYGNERRIALLAGPDVAGIETTAHVRRAAGWETYAAMLYRWLWEAERSGASVVLASDADPTHAPALADRLARAAGVRFRRGNPLPVDAEDPLPAEEGGETL